MSSNPPGEGDENTAGSPAESPSTSDDSLANERRIPSVNRVRSLQSRATTVLTIGVMCGFALVMLIWYYTRGLSDESSASSNRTVRRASSTADTFLPALTGMPEPPPEELPTRAAAAANTQVSTRATGRGRQATPPERQLTAPVFARQRSTASTPGGGGRLNSPSSEAGLGSQATGGEENGADLASLLRSTGHRRAAASRLFAPHMTLRAGTHIPCTLETAITSSLPGTTRCIAAADTWSADGSVVLIERGTSILGETRNVGSQGIRRIFIVWTHAYTPQQIDVPLEAPGTDALGRSGVPGEVDYHFFERFGAAMLISIIDGGVQAASRSRVGDNSVVINPNTSRDLLTEILRQTANIRPTRDVRQGALVQIAVPRNVDFGAVYELTQPTEP